MTDVYLSLIASGPNPSLRDPVSPFAPVLHRLSFQINLLDPVDVSWREAKYGKSKCGSWFRSAVNFVSYHTAFPAKLT